MNRNSEVREFLVSRRARITPEQAGLPAYGTNRRVKGLRREEAATLAGVSIDYYTQLERGNLAGASESVLDSLARALQLDEAERAHLYDLARAANSSASARRRTGNNRVRPGVQRVLNAMTGAPAWIRNDRSDILAVNTLGRALYAPIFDDPVQPPNTARFTFLSPQAKARSTPTAASPACPASPTTSGGRWTGRYGGSAPTTSTCCTSTGSTRRCRSRTWPGWSRT